MNANVFLLLGSNLGDREEMMIKAKEMIICNCGMIVSESCLYETESWGFHTETPFLNQAINLYTHLSPANLLQSLQHIESEMGRIRKSDIYESRTIDIDILLFQNNIINEPSLKIPHPRLHLRRFALIPLNEIASTVIHPILNKTISELLSSCTDDLMVNLYHEA